MIKQETIKLTVEIAEGEFNEQDVLIVDAMRDGSVSVADALTKIGNVGGAGADSMAKAAQLSTLAVAAGLAIESDAEAHYDLWRAGYDAKSGKSDKVEDAGSRTGMISQWRTFTKHGIAKHNTIHEKALKVRASLATDERKFAVFQSLLAVNRVQNKQPAKALTVAEIKAILQKEPAEAKTQLQKLQALAKSAEKIHKDYGGMLKTLAEIDAAIKAHELELEALATEEQDDSNVTLLITKQAA